MRKTWCVYKHVFPDGKLYIGSTGCRPEKRWANGYGYSGQTNMFEAIMKYGWNNVKHEIIADGLEEKEARDLERKTIESIPKENLYNCELYANGRIKAEKKNLDNFQVGEGMRFDSLNMYMTSAQIDAFHKRLGYSYPFVEIKHNHLLISYFKSYGNTLECTQWISYYPVEGLKRKDFGKWLSEDATFLKIYHSMGEVNLNN